MSAISGYANRVLRKDFPELSSGSDDPIWVVIRNPRLLPDGELASAWDGVNIEDGKVTDREQVRHAAAKAAVKLIVAARAYDATHVPQFDQQGEVIPGTGDAPLLPPTPWQPETALKLPRAITDWLGEQITESVNPTQTPATPTTSSS